MMEEIKDLKRKFLSIIQTQINGDLSKVNAKELGEIVDCMKDCAEIEYYCSIVSAMEKNNSEENSQYINQYIPETNSSSAKYYTKPYWHYEDPEYKRDIDRINGRMYFTNMDDYRRDEREGRSPISRKTYVEMVSVGADKASKLKELEHYMEDLAMDITEVISNMQPDEKVIVKQKLTNLASKVV